MIVLILNLGTVFGTKKTNSDDRIPTIFDLATSVTSDAPPLPKMANNLPEIDKNTI